MLNKYLLDEFLHITGMLTRLRFAFWFGLSFSHYKKLPYPVSLKQQTFIAHSFGGWQVQNEGASRSGANEGFIPGLQMAVFSLWPRERPFLLCIFLEGHYFCLSGLHPHDLILTQSPHLQTPSWQAVRISTCEFWGVINNQSTTVTIIINISITLLIKLQVSWM